MVFAVPSMKRPQPATKSVSPQKSAGASPCSTKLTWPRVWQGVATQRKERPSEKRDERDCGKVKCYILYPLNH